MVKKKERKKRELTLLLMKYLTVNSNQGFNHINRSFQHLKLPSKKYRRVTDV